jgi:transcriptional regulator with XRE-family HTH domain
MTTGNVNGIRGEYRRLTSAEVGLMIRMIREAQGIKRAALAADANMSEKTLERAESGRGISEESCCRIARALGIREDTFVNELYVPGGPEEAERMLKERDDQLRATHQQHPVLELKGARDVLPLFRAHFFYADDQNVAEGDMVAFAGLKDSWWEWNMIASDISESELVQGAQGFLAEVRSFESLGYVVKAGTSERHYNGTAVPVAVLVAFKKPRGTTGTADAVWLPKQMRAGF